MLLNSQFVQFLMEVLVVKEFFYSVVLVALSHFQNVKLLVVVLHFLGEGVYLGLEVFNSVKHLRLELEETPVNHDDNRFLLLKAVILQPIGPQVELSQAIRQQANFLRQVR